MKKHITYNIFSITICFIVFAMVSETTFAADTAGPTAPGNLTAVTSSPTQVDLRWKASIDVGGGRVAGYDIYRDGVKIRMNVTTTSFRDTGVQPGIQHRYQVDAFDNASPRNKSAKSNVAVAVRDTAGPTAPGNLTAVTSSPTQVDLKWKASIDVGGGRVAGYDIYRDGAKIRMNVTTTSFRDTGVQPGIQHRYQVDAFDNASPRNKSAKSNVAVAVRDTAGPTAPGNLTAVTSSPTQVDLKWKASTDVGGGRVAGYDIYRDGAKIRMNVTTTSFRDTGVQPGIQHRYQVDAFDNASPRNKSAKSNVAVAVRDTAGPTAPGNLTAVTSSPTQVDLKWKASTDVGGGRVAGYDIYRDGAKIRMNVTTTSFRDTGVQPGTQYRYQVDAFDNASPNNKSGKSNWASVSTPTEAGKDEAGPTAPGNLTAQASSPTQVNLAWAASIDLGGGVVTGYDIYRDGAKLTMNVTSTSFRDTKVRPDTRYSYRVSAHDNASPRNTSSKSNWASVTTSEAAETESDTKPTTPPNLTGKAVGPKKVNLWWTSSRATGDGVMAGYEIYRDGVLIASVAELSYSDLNVQANTAYGYRVLAFDDSVPANKSIASSTIQISTPTNGPSCSGVAIFPSNNAVKIIKAHAWGTTFCFKAGTHQLSAPINTRANDRYIGDRGAVLDGRNTITHAFFGRSGATNQQNVTIRGLIIQNFRTIFGHFETRNVIKAGDNWTVENNEIRNNVDTGIHLGQGIILRNNYIHHNGRYGITVGPGLNQNILVDGNEIAHNNTRNLNWATAGTAKVIGASIGATGLKWINNWIHHNNGHGLHHDYNVGPNIEMAFNRIEGNEGSGIQHEASWGANIHDNVTINNARKLINKSCAHGGQIRLLMSSNVHVHHNHVESTEESNGICLTDSLGDLTPPASTTINNVKILDNTIKLIGTAQTGVIGSDVEGRNLAKNVFDRNTYYVPEPNTGVNWTWYTIRGEWQRKGQDRNSVFRTW